MQGHNDWRLKAEIPLPQRRDYPIAIVGAGGIVNDAHLPAYRKAGFHVIGIYDVEAEGGAQRARGFGIATVYDSLDELLSGPAAICEGAVTAYENLAIARRVPCASKALLLQKPLSEDLASAQAIANIVEEAGIVAAVNQQARWMPAAIAIRDLLRRELLGEVYQVSFLINVETPWRLWPWIVTGERVEVMYHSIHYLDMIRSLLGKEPRLVFADGMTVPGYPTNAETRTVIQLIFQGNLRATITDNHHNIGGLAHQYTPPRFERTRSSTLSDLGLLKNYPAGIPDQFGYMSQRLQPGTWITPHLEGSWFPDAFIGTMGSVMRALEGQEPAPETPVRDNLNTLRLLFPPYATIKA